MKEKFDWGKFWFHLCGALAIVGLITSTIAGYKISEIRKKEEKAKVEMASSHYDTIVVVLDTTNYVN